VLPTLGLDGRVTYVQARYLDPVEGRPKYDNPASRIATNPRIGWINPARVTDRNHLVVCEGVIDSLSVAGVGTPAVAILGRPTSTNESPETSQAERRVARSCSPSTVTTRVGMPARPSPPRWHQSAARAGLSRCRTAAT